MEEYREAKPLIVAAIYTINDKSSKFEVSYNETSGDYRIDATYPSGINHNLLAFGENEVWIIFKYWINCIGRGSERGSLMILIGPREKEKGIFHTMTEFDLNKYKEKRSFIRNMFSDWISLIRGARFLSK